VILINSTARPARFKALPTDKIPRGRIFSEWSAEWLIWINIIINLLNIYSAKAWV